MAYLLYVGKPTGYELEEHEGEPPAVGSEIDEDGERMRVGRIGPSPYPGDPRPCAYLLPA